VSNVIEFSPKVEIKEQESNYQDHDYILDACDEVFEYGAVVLALTADGSVELSSTVENEEEVVDMLVAAAVSVQKRFEKNEDN